MTRPIIYRNYLLVDAPKQDKLVDLGFALHYRPHGLQPSAFRKEHGDPFVPLVYDTPPQHFDGEVLTLPNSSHLRHFLATTYWGTGQSIPPIYWQLPEWLSDQGVWNAAADEVVARLGQDNVSASEDRSWGVFTDLPRVYIEPHHELYHKPCTAAWQRHLIDNWARHNPWRPPFADRVTRRYVETERCHNYVPAEGWKARSGQRPETPSYTWSFIEGLLHELRLPGFLFGRRCPKWWDRHWRDDALDIK